MQSVSIVGSEIRQNYEATVAAASPPAVMASPVPLPVPVAAPVAAATVVATALVQAPEAAIGAGTPVLAPGTAPSPLV